MDRGQFIQLVRGRRFQQLVAVRVTGTTADGLLEAALTSFVLFSPTRESTPLKILTAFGVLLLPYSLLGPFVGVVIDRWQRQRILVISTLTRAVLVLVVAGIVAAGRSDSLLGIAVLATLGVGRFVQATLSASLPHVVEQDQLVGANAIAPTSGTLTSIIGGLIGVGVATIMGGTDQAAVYIICVAAAFHLVSSLVSTSIPRALLGPHQVRTQSMRDVFEWLRSGLAYLFAHARALRAILRVSAHRVAFGGATLLVLMLTRNTFNDLQSARQALGEFTFVIGVAGAGAFASAVVTPLVADRLGVARWGRSVLAVSSVIVGLSYVFATREATALAWPLVLIGSAFIGFSGQTAKITSDTIVQTSIADSHRGRVFAWYDMALNLGIVGGTAAGALVMPVSGQSPAFALFIAVVLLVAALIRD